MLGFVRKISSHLYLPVGWTILTIILLCLPGSAIPSVGMYGLSDIDKAVHFILFGCIPFFWGIYTTTRSSYSKWKKWLAVFCLSSISLGIILEFVQFYFIPNRDFDIMDILADTIGALFFTFLLFALEKQSAVKKEKPL